MTLTERLRSDCDGAARFALLSGAHSLPAVSSHSFAKEAVDLPLARSAAARSAASCRAWRRPSSARRLTWLPAMVMFGSSIGMLSGGR